MTKRIIIALAAVALLAGCGSSGPAAHKKTPAAQPTLTAIQQSYTTGYDDGEGIPAVGSARTNCEVEWIEDYASPGLIESAWLSGCIAGVAAGS